MLLIVRNEIADVQKFLYFIKTNVFIKILKNLNFQLNKSEKLQTSWEANCTSNWCRLSLTKINNDYPRN